MSSVDTSNKKSQIKIFKLFKKKQNATENTELIKIEKPDNQEQKSLLDNTKKDETEQDKVKINIIVRIWTRIKQFTIDPFSDFYYVWLIIISLCYMYNLIFLIARSAFWLLQDIDYWFIWIILDYFISDFIYLLDIFFRFLTGFMQNGEVCKDKKQISKQYTKTLQYKIDIFSVLPTDLLYFFFSHKTTSRLLPALRLNRLFRYGRLAEFRAITETQTKFPTIFRMTNLLINILIAMHWNACIYFIVSYFVGFGSDEWVFPAPPTAEQLANLTDTQKRNMLLTNELDVQYIYCFWWSVQTLSTIAEVPEPRKYYQELYMSALLMAGIIILAITIGSAGDMVENANRSSLDLQMKSDYAKSFLKQNKITGELETRIKNYLDYLWITPDVDQEDILVTLPFNLRKEIAMSVHIETLKRVQIFQDCEPGLLEELVTKLKLQVYSPGDYVCRKGDVGHEMYFIKMGSLQVVSPDGTKVFATLKAGAAFGEISILDIPGNKNGNKRTANIRSLGFSDVFQLSKTDLWAALSEFPIAKKQLLEKGKALLKKDNLLDEKVAEEVERKHKPIHEQIEYFQTNKFDGLTEKYQDAFKVYADFIKEAKKTLNEMEETLGY